MQYGLAWPGALVARQAEAAGASAFCSGEFVDHDAYTSLTEMLAGTDHALVGPGIAYAFSRTPYAHATAIRSLWHRGEGRMFLGLGSGAFRINRDWFGVEADRPTERVSDLVGAIRAWLHAEKGDKVTYHGEFYHVDADVRAPVLGRIDMPILLAGFNKRMVAAGARTGDGIIAHGLFTRSWWDDVARPALERGAAESGRVATPLEHGYVITAVNDGDPERAVMDARRMVAFYLTVKTYDPYVEFHGWQSQVSAIREAFHQRDVDGMAHAVTDHMLEEIALCGTTADARSALAKRTGALARDVVYFQAPSFLVSERRRREYARASLALIPS